MEIENNDTEVAQNDEPISQTNPVDVVEVYHWDSARYLGDEINGDPFAMEMTDRRSSNGQVAIDFAPMSGEPDDVLSVLIEVSRLPGSRDDVQCVHVAFGPDNMRFSVFKQGNRLILRPASSDIGLLSTVLPDGTSAFIIE